MSVVRSFLYRSDCPKGEIFVGEEAIAAAEEDGWVDSPVGLDGEAPSPAPESEPETETPADPPVELEPDAPDEPAEDSEDAGEPTDN